MTVNEATATERERLLAVIQEAAVETLGDDAPVLNESMHLGEEFQVDSLDLVEMMMIVEERLEIEVDTDDLKSIVCVGDLVDVLAVITA